MNKSLAQLAEEYAAAIKATEEITEKTRREIMLAKKSCNTDEIKRLGAKLFMLYEEIRDMRMIAEKLRHYYDDDEKRYQEAV